MTLRNTRSSCLGHIESLKSLSRAKKCRYRPTVEVLESRLVMATAGGVENILLPEFIAQLADPNGNQLPASDAWWALRSQRNMAIDEPISKVMNFAAHNAFNSLNEGFRIIPFLGPNQILSLSGQLDLGARSIELDIHDPVGPTSNPLEFTRALILKHGSPPFIVSRNVPFFLDQALNEVRDWLDRPENRNEVIFLDFEDATEQNENAADDPLLPKLQDHFGSLIYTPAERAVDGVWPSRAELVSRDKQVVIFSHRNDEFHGRFGVPQEFVDPNGHRWFGSSLAFRANGKDDPVSDRGNYTQVSIDDFVFNTAPAEDANAFFSVQSDGLRNFTARRYDELDVRNAAALNVDFLKMDFLFGDDEDADLGLNGLLPGDPTFDPFFDIPQDNRIGLLEAAVWSWKKNDPAVDRQMFQNLVPGDGTGAAMFDRLAARIAALGDRLDPATMQILANIGAASRNNGRDVTVLRDGRWESSETASSTSMRFAARSVAPDAAGQFQWQVTAAASTNWFDGYQLVRNEFGSGFVFHGPVNGFQNVQLRNASGGADVWINVHDFDHDGNWQIGNRAPRITSLNVQPAASREGESVRLTVAFSDDPEGHDLNIDWGDGSARTVVHANATQSFAVASHNYRDDNPTATASDLYNIHVTLSDDGGLSDSSSTQVTVSNLAPAIGALASDATFANPAAEGQTIKILASFTDPGTLDSHRATVDWGDGSGSQLVTVNQGAGSGTVTGSHAYAFGGVYTITLSLADDDTGVATATTTAVIRGVGLNNGTLFIIGGQAGDDASVNQTGNGKLKVHVNFIRDKSRDFDAAIVSRIIAYLGRGDDHLSVSNNVRIPLVVHGGAGNDHLGSGGGPSVLLGDEGNDHLGGQGGRSILIGGSGEDSLVAGAGGDVLIGGSTATDQNDHALFSAVAAWNALSSYAARVAAIDALLVVWDDGDKDRITGGAGLDLYYHGEDDILAAVKKDEVVLPSPFRTFRGAAMSTGAGGLTFHEMSPLVNTVPEVQLSSSGLLHQLVAITDPGWDKWTAMVDFGDSGGPQSVDVQVGQQLLLHHRYQQPGTYLVKVVVTDDDGSVGTSSFRVRLADRLEPSLVEAFYAWFDGHQQQNKPRRLGER